MLQPKLERIIQSFRELWTAEFGQTFGGDQLVL